MEFSSSVNSVELGAAALIVLGILRLVQTSNILTIVIKGRQFSQLETTVLMFGSVFVDCSVSLISFESVCVLPQASVLGLAYFCGVGVYTSCYLY